MTGNKYKYTNTDAPTMAEECYSIINAGTKVPFLRNKHQIKDYSKLSLQKRLQKLEYRIDMLDDMLGDDITELRCEIDDIKKKLSDTKCPASQKSKSKTKHICNTSSGSEFEYEYDEYDEKH